MEAKFKQPVQSLYIELFNHAPNDIICSLIAENIVAIVLEQSATLPEQVLLARGHTQTAKTFRHQLDIIFERRLRKLLSDICRRPIADVLSEYQRESGRMSLMVVFGQKSYHRY